MAQNKSTSVGVMGTKARLEWIVIKMIIHTKRVLGTPYVLKVWQILLRNNVVSDFVGSLQQLLSLPLYPMPHFFFLKHSTSPNHSSFPLSCMPKDEPLLVQVSFGSVIPLASDQFRHRHANQSWPMEIEGQSGKGFWQKFSLLIKIYSCSSLSSNINTCVWDIWNCCSYLHSDSERNC